MKNVIYYNLKGSGAICYTDVVATTSQKINRTTKINL